jgi:hypothetical protein
MHAILILLQPLRDIGTQRWSVSLHWKYSQLKPWHARPKRAHCPSDGAMAPKSSPGRCPQKLRALRKATAKKDNGSWKREGERAFGNPMKFVNQSASTKHGVILQYTPECSAFPEVRIQTTGRHYQLKAIQAPPGRNTTSVWR